MSENQHHYGTDFTSVTPQAALLQSVLAGRINLKFLDQVVGNLPRPIQSPKLVQPLN
jgi:hypothetical protein